MAASNNRKRSRDVLDILNGLGMLDDEQSKSPPAKKQRLQKNPLDLLMAKKDEYIDIDCCNINFTANQPIKTVSGVYKWKATLSHRCYQDDGSEKIAILAQSSFSVTDVKNLKNELNDLIDKDEFHYKVLFIENIKTMDNFHGFGYEFCLIQRIIDNHSRFVDITVIKQNNNNKHICQKLGFSQMKQSIYWYRNEKVINPSIHNFSKKQQITDNILSHYTDEEKLNNNNNNNNDNNNNIDINECVIIFTSTQNATNTMIEEDYASSWHCELKYKSEIIADGRFWFIHFSRASNEGHEISDIFTMLDAQCQELYDLFSIIDKDGWNMDGLFNLCEQDRWNLFKVRNKKLLIDEPLDDSQKMALKELVIKNVRLDEMNEGGGGNLIYLDRIKVNKKYGGYGYGRCLTQKIIDNFVRAFDGIVLKPFPLQWEVRNQSNDNKKEFDKKLFEKDKQKVIEIWESMWFYNFGGPNSEYWGRSAAWTHPKMEEFCKCLQ